MTTAIGMTLNCTASKSTSRRRNGKSTAKRKRGLPANHANRTNLMDGYRVRCLSFAAILLASSVAADDWPQWGGPQRDLVWREDGVVDTLPEGQLPRMWA